eukprot:Opistho-1_new@42913
MALCKTVGACFGRPLRVNCVLVQATQFDDLAVKCPQAITRLRGGTARLRLNLPHTSLGIVEGGLKIRAGSTQGAVLRRKRVPLGPQRAVLYRKFGFLGGFGLRKSIHGLLQHDDLRPKAIRLASQPIRLASQRVILYAQSVRFHSQHPELRLESVLLTMQGVLLRRELSLECFRVRTTACWRVIGGVRALSVGGHERIGDAAQTHCRGLRQCDGVRGALHQRTPGIDKGGCVGVCCRRPATRCLRNTLLRPHGARGRGGRRARVLLRFRQCHVVQVRIQRKRPGGARRICSPRPRCLDNGKSVVIVVCHGKGR